MQTQMLIGGRLVGGRGAAARRCWTRPRARSDRRGGRGHPGAGGRGGGGGRARLRRLGRDRAARTAPRRCCASRTHSKRDAADYAALESQQHRQAARGGAERRDAGDRRRVPLLCRRVPHPQGPAGGRVPARTHQHDPPRSGRGRGFDRALELSADDGRLEDRAGDRRRQHRGAEALRADAAHGTEARPQRWPSCCRRAWST